MCICIEISFARGTKVLFSGLLVDSTLLGYIDCVSKGSIVVAVHLTWKQEYLCRQFYSIFLKKW